MENYELYHHGVKGQKWGVRRYRNKDGSLTPAGKKRYADKTEGWSDDAKTAYKLSQKSINQLSNDELRRLNERKNLEQNYRRLNPNTVQKGMAIVAGTAAALGTTLNLINKSDKALALGKVAVGKAAEVIGNISVASSAKYINVK